MKDQRIGAESEVKRTGRCGWVEIDLVKACIVNHPEDENMKVNQYDTLMDCQQGNIWKRELEDCSRIKLT